MAQVLRATNKDSFASSDPCPVSEAGQAAVERTQLRQCVEARSSAQGPRLSLWTLPTRGKCGLRATIRGSLSKSSSWLRGTGGDEGGLLLWGLP